MRHTPEITLLSMSSSLEAQLVAKRAVAMAVIARNNFMGRNFAGVVEVASCFWCPLVLAVRLLPFPLFIGSGLFGCIAVDVFADFLVSDE